MKMLKKVDDQANRLLYKLWFCVLIIFPFTAVSFRLDPDIWHILNNGRYLLQKGIPYTDPFTLHEGLSYVAQQWLADGLFWVIYDAFGKLGLMLMLIAAGGIMYVLMYRLCRLTTNSSGRYALYFTAFSLFFLFFLFLKTRPQIISFICWITELLVLELYVRRGKKLPLLLIPLLAVVEINCHAALWLMIPALIVPYLADTLPVRFLCLQADRSYSWKWPAGILAGSFLAGFCNPYGLRGMLLIFRSLSADMTRYIGELRPLAADSAIGIFYLFLAFAALFIMLADGKPIHVRSFLMLLGGIAASLMAKRNICIFIIASTPFLAGKISEMRKKSRVLPAPEAAVQPSLRQLRVRTCVKVLTCLVYAAACVCGLLIPIQGLSDIREDQEAESLAPIVDYLAEESGQNLSDVRLYTGFNSGAYCEFRGLRCYIDARAEVFLKSNNGVKDYINEYANVAFQGTQDYRDFIREYNFTHMLVSNEGMFYNLLKTDPNLRIVFETDDYCLLKCE